MMGKHLWFVRRQGVVRGPFPERQLRSELLLGRLHLDDEISRDRAVWIAVRDEPTLVAEDLHGKDPEALARARVQADERSGTDRRDGTAAAADADRRSDDRRQSEPANLVEQRRRRRRVLRGLAESRSGNRLALAVVMGLMAVAVLLALLRGSDPEGTPVRCDAPPAPAVNWSNCRLEQLEAPQADLSRAQVRNARLFAANLLGARLAEADFAYADLGHANLSYTDLRGSSLRGANLQGADLAYADLRGSDLSFADLSGAQLGGAELAEVRLDHAIWTDRRVCAPGSRGDCRAQSP